MPSPKTSPEKSVDGVPVQEVASPQPISPQTIRRNDQNPRLDFNTKRLEALADSIEEQGVLVPVTVYRDPGDDGTEFVLLDGERRWRAAKLINKPEIPAWVIKKPTPSQNVLTMFNIHMLRDEWGEMATAIALKHVMEELGTKTDPELSKLTGLSPDRIKNMRRVLQYPEEWQAKVLEGEIPFQLLVELDKAISTKKKSRRSFEFDEKKVRDRLLQKYMQGTMTDVVDLRKVGALVDTAARGDKIGERAKKAFFDLIDNEDATVDEAYQKGAAAAIELTGILRDINGLPERVGALLETELEAEHRMKLAQTLDWLAGEIKTLRARL